MDGNVGLADAMLRLKEKAEEMVWELVALQREQEKLQANTDWLFCKLEWGNAVEAPAGGRQTTSRHGLQRRTWTRPWLQTH